MKNVPRPISVMVTKNVYFRPTMSPTRPNTSAPNGLTANPAANASSVKMKPTLAHVGKEVLSEEDAQRPVNVEVVPLEHRTERGCEYDQSLLGRHAPRFSGPVHCNCCHKPKPPSA